MVLNINSDAAVQFTRTLETMHRSALPSAIRGTLNRAAFDVKKVTMPASSQRRFVNRKPNFFKANSSVQMASGFNVPSMRAIVGFVSANANYNNYAVLELEEQEYGGDIDHRTFVPLDSVRTGSSRIAPVRPGNRLRNLRKLVNDDLSNIVESNRGRGMGKGQFVSSAIHVGKGGLIIGNFGKKILYKIEDITREKGKTKIKTRPLYSFEQGRSVHIKETHFMRDASMESAGKMERFFAEEAERQIVRLTTKRGFL